MELVTLIDASPGAVDAFLGGFGETQRPSFWYGTRTASIVASQVLAANDRVLVGVADISRTTMSGQSLHHSFLVITRIYLDGTLHVTGQVELLDEFDDIDLSPRSDSPPAPESLQSFYVGFVNREGIGFPIRDFPDFISAHHRDGGQVTFNAPDGTCLYADWRVSVEDFEVIGRIGSVTIVASRIVGSWIPKRGFRISAPEQFRHRDIAFISGANTGDFKVEWRHFY